MTIPDQQMRRIRRWNEQGLGVHPDDARALLADRDRLHAIYKAADEALIAYDTGTYRRELLALAALIGAYEGGSLP
jgi:hypothetical protein